MAAVPRAGDLACAYSAAQSIFDPPIRR